MNKVKPRSTYKIITKEVKIIRSLREKRGLSVNRAAPLIGTNKSTLTSLENGRINLSEAWLEKILKAYRIRQDEFEKISEGDFESKEELLNEILLDAKKLEQEKLIMVRQLIRGLVAN